MRECQLLSYDIIHHVGLFVYICLSKVEVIWFETNVLTVRISENYLSKHITVIRIARINLVSDLTLDQTSVSNLGLSGKFGLSLWSQTKV